MAKQKMTGDSALKSNKNQFINYQNVKDKEFIRKSPKFGQNNLNFGIKEEFMVEGNKIDKKEAKFRIKNIVCFIFSHRYMILFYFYKLKKPVGKILNLRNFLKNFYTLTFIFNQIFGDIPAKTF